MTLIRQLIRIPQLQSTSKTTISRSLLSSSNPTKCFDIRHKNISRTLSSSPISGSTSSQPRHQHYQTITTPLDSNPIEFSGPLNFGRGGENGQTAEEEAASEEEERFKSDLLELALTHVSTCGWSTEAISKAAEQAGLSSAAGSLFTDADLVHYFISKSNRELEEHVSSKKGDDATAPLTLQQALEWRLRKVVPFAPTYSEAIAIISHPQHLPKSLKLLMEISDSIAHHVLKDSSADLNWYSKRMGIAAIFVSTELTLVQDGSEGYLETWKFLERRCQEFDKYGKGQLNPIGVPLPELFHVGFTTFMNLIGRNAKR